MVILITVFISEKKTVWRPAIEILKIKFVIPLKINISNN